MNKFFVSLATSGGLLVTNMDQDPTGIKDSMILIMRASLKMSKKSVDDILVRLGLSLIE